MKKLFMVFFMAISSLSGFTQEAQKFSFLIAPRNTVQNQRFTEPVQVAITDASGSVLASASDEAALSLQSVSGSVMIMGATTMKAVNGVVTFADLSVPQPGTYRLIAHEPVHVVGRWSDDFQSESIVYTDVWVEGNFAYLGRWRPGGVCILDISNPAQPKLVVHWHRDTENNVFKDIKVRNGIGFFASDNGGGVHIVDLTDPYNPIDLAVITSRQNGYDSVHNLYVEGDYLYLASFRNPKIGVFNVADPSNPVFVRNIPSNYSAPVHDITARNGRLFSSHLGANRTGYTEIFDIANIETAAPRLGDFASGAGTHSNWPTDDLHYLFVSQEMFHGILSVWDIRNPTQAMQIKQLMPISMGPPPFSPHNPLIAGKRLYVSWYDSGLQVFDIQEPQNPRPIVFYDTYPDSRTVDTFIGAWGVFPFLGANRILVSDTQYGLFIIDTTAADTEIAISEPFEVTAGVGILNGEWLMY